MRKAIAIGGGLFAAGWVAFIAWFYWEDPFIRRNKTLERMLRIELPLDS